MEVTSWDDGALLDLNHFFISLAYLQGRTQRENNISALSQFTEKRIALNLKLRRTHTGAAYKTIHPTGVLNGRHLIHRKNIGSELYLQGPIMHEMHYTQLVTELVSRDVSVPAKCSGKTEWLYSSHDVDFPR